MSYILDFFTWQACQGVSLLFISELSFEQKTGTPNILNSDLIEQKCSLFGVGNIQMHKKSFYNSIHKPRITIPM